MEVIRSVGNKAAYSTGTIAVDATGLIITLSGGTFSTDWGEGDDLTIDTGGTPETRYVKTRDSDTQLTLQIASTKTSQSGLAYSLARAYSSLSSWESAEETDLITATDTHKCVGYDSFDAGSVYINGWTTDSSYYITLTVADGHYHEGDKTKGTYIDNGGSDGYFILADEDFTIVEKWRATNAGDHWSSQGILSRDQDCIFRRNLVHDSYRYGIYLHQGDSAHRTKVYNNIIIGILDGEGSGTGIRSYQTDYFSYLWNNTVVDCESSGILCDGSHTGTDDDVRNNICLGNTVNFNLLLSSVVADYNAGETGNMPGEGSNNVTTTKAETFNNAAGGDYSIKVGSPVIMAGDYISEVLIDIIGTARPGASYSDIGAYQYVDQNVTQKYINLYKQRVA